MDLRGVGLVAQYSGCSLRNLRVLAATIPGPWQPQSSCCGGTVFRLWLKGSRFKRGVGIKDFGFTA